MTSEFLFRPQDCDVNSTSNKLFPSISRLLYPNRAIATVEEYIFSAHSNFIDCHGGADYPAMLSRCLALTSTP